MTYYAKTQKMLLVFLLTVITVPLITSQNINSVGFIYFQILFSLMILLSIFIKYKFRIEKETLHYQISIMNIPIYTKVAYPKQIMKIECKRVGWYRKCALIKLNKGFNIRIIHFTPEEVFEELINFANDHGIALSKTNEFSTSINHLHK